jgi:hypothetical protein
MPLSPIDPDLRRLAHEIGAAMIEELFVRLRKGDGSLFMMPEYVTPAQAAIITGIKLKKLEFYRHKSIGPKFYRLGGRIHYRVADLRDFVEKEGRVE